MSGFRGMWEYLDSADAGKSHYSFWRKTPSQTTTAGVWFDMSMSPGNPNPIYYAATPLVAAQLKRSTDGGINHGSAIGSDKNLKRFLIMAAAATPLPMPFVLADYLMFYPFIDTGTNDAQALDNTATLPRFTDGEGVMMMAVSVAASSGLSPTFNVSYTNSDGVSGRTSQTMILNTATANGAIVTASQAAAQSCLFIGLQEGDRGVRSVESVTFLSGTDVGLFSLVLVKPLATGCLLEQTAPCEIEFIAHQSSVPTIQDDAFLGVIALPNGSMSGVAFHGEIETIWS